MATSPRPKEVKVAYRFQRVYPDLQTGHALTVKATRADSVMAATDHGMAMTDCHDAETAPEPADLPQPAHAGHDGASDCCQAGDSCHCDCQQHSPLTMQQVVMLGAQTVDTPVVPNADAGRAAPPPQRLIRPPIAA